MKTSITYGFIMTLCGAFVGLALYFTGFHADVDKLKTAQNISIVIGIIISVCCILLGMREKRANTPADKSWGYGSALGTGVMIGLFGAVFGAVYNYVYFAYIDPNFREVVLQAQIAALEAKNLSAAQIEQAEPYIRPWLSPVAMIREKSARSRAVYPGYPAGLIHSGATGAKRKTRSRKAPRLFLPAGNTDCAFRAPAEAGRLEPPLGAAGRYPAPCAG
jgi:hypothetical protein